MDFDSVFSKRRQSPFGGFLDADRNANPMGFFPDGGIAGRDIANGAITAEKISAGAIEADHIAANAISSSHIEAGSITVSHLAGETIVGNRIAAETIEANNIAAAAITAEKIAAGSVTAEKILAGAVTTEKLEANAVTAEKIAANTITASEIAADSITTNELAANAVITENVLAGNITSSRIELTVSGKRFGANSGSTSAPGLFFDSDSDTGMYLAGTGSIGISLGGGASFLFDPIANVSDNDIEPGTDNLYRLGNAAFRWTEVWAVDGSINTSDRRLKRDIADSPLGLDFVRSLKPRVYRWKETVDTQAVEQAESTFDREALERELRPHREQIEQARERLNELPANDPEVAELEASITEARAAIKEARDRASAPIREAHNKRRPGRRLHFGLIADELKESLDDAGVDAAFYKDAPTGMTAIAYSELIAVLIKAVQEQDEVIAGLTDRVEALERA